VHSTGVRPLQKLVSGKLRTRGVAAFDRGDAGVVVWEKFSRPQGDVDQADQHGHLDQRPDDRRKRLAAVDPEGGDGHRYRQLKIV
jgi:hypothetical protein